jgi:hypothetical protein
VSAVPELRTIRGIELVKVGTWQISNGEWTVTPADLQSAVAAHKAAILRKPVVKLGHTAMADAGPALGYVDNLRLADAGNTLVGDLVNVPAAVAKLLPFSYPDRSVEAMTNYEAPDGTVWPMVLTACALLGATQPGIDTLKSLQDVAQLYGVAAARRITIAASAFRPDPAAARHRSVAVAAARRRRTHRTTIGV